MGESQLLWVPPWVRAAKAGWPVAGAAVVAVLQVAGTTAAGRHQDGRVPLDGWGYLLLVVGPALLVLRRRWPAGTVAAVTAVTAGYLWAGYPYGPSFLAMVVAFFGAVRHGHRRAAWLSGGAFYLVHLLVGYVLPDGWQRAAEHGVQGWQELGVTAWLLLVFAGAELARFRQERIAAVRAAEEEARARRNDEERLRTARELHDILAHSISLIHVQAGVALELLDARPEQARDALTTIKATSKEALGEVRQVLGTLRGPGAAAPRTPAPGLERLDELVEQAGHAGLAVTVERRGRAARAGAGLELAAFRIVQEALTNVLRHSTARTATVELAWDRAALTVTVTDPGPPGGGDAGGSGSGLTGVRERAAALGGSAGAGPDAAGGWRVRARLPLAGNDRRNGPGNGSESGGTT
ncbi:two-component sensor histidine kinase [Kitasatospora phosalacinea]|uniref:histidine kinase n=1 Tax=Kitasatospora phosalacinea TaxID=2065 RepID=A0A9W6QF68_9ACTN|nr:histidine kinase [Kitasatospora phosalacinea]GLW73392.1 two-component sensor histidine kinase [Kitasatospora phosalacinea]